jgi:hypothetical protein
MEPSRQEITEAVEQFKAQGGIIKQIVPSDITGKEPSLRVPANHYFHGGTVDPLEGCFSLTKKS